MNTGNKSAEGTRAETMREKRLGGAENTTDPLPVYCHVKVQATSHEMFLAHIMRLLLGYCKSVPQSGSVVHHTLCQVFLF